jgi:pilus assembly protein Flp/PilA
MKMFMRGRRRALRAQQKGLTTVEYAIAGTLVALAVVTAFTALGGAVGTQIQSIVTVLGG